MLNFILKRLKEPSTYAGAAACAASFGVVLPPNLIGLVAQGGIFLAGLAGMLLPEKYRH